MNINYFQNFVAENLPIILKVYQEKFVNNFFTKFNYGEVLIPDRRKFNCSEKLLIYNNWPQQGGGGIENFVLPRMPASGICVVRS